MRTVVQHTHNPLRVAFVVPVYHSEKTLEELCARIFRFGESQGWVTNCILVDDRSGDESWQKIVDLKRRYPDAIRGIRLARNFGQTAATRCGLHAADADFVFTLDDDLQTPPEECAKLMHKLQAANAQVVYGMYVTKSHSIIRNMGSLAFRRLFHTLSGGVQIGSSFRLIKGELAKKIGSYLQSGPLIEELIHWHSFSVAFTEVAHETRRSGRSGYSLLRLFALALKLLFFHTRLLPLLARMTGLLFSLGGTALLVLTHEPEDWRVPAILMICTGILLVFLGGFGSFIRNRMVYGDSIPAWSVEEVAG